jgi:hypothetical protein
MIRNRCCSIRIVSEVWLILVAGQTVYQCICVPSELLQIKGILGSDIPGALVTLNV